MLTKRRSNKKATGGRYSSAGRNSKWHEARGLPTNTKVGTVKKKTLRVRGGETKTKLLEADIVNLVSKKTKKTIKAKILNVVDSPANRHFVRRNIITKGAIVETDKGKAKITSRPGQEGTLNAVLVE